MKGAVITPINQVEMAVLYLDRNFAMNFVTWNSLTGNQSSGNFFPKNLGGVFTSAPAVTATANDRIDVFGLGTDYSVYHKTWTRAPGGSAFASRGKPLKGTNGWSRAISTAWTGRIRSLIL